MQAEDRAAHVAHFTAALYSPNPPHHRLRISYRRRLLEQSYYYRC